MRQWQWQWHWHWHDNNLLDERVRYSHYLRAGGRARAGGRYAQRVEPSSRSSDEWRVAWERERGGGGAAAEGTAGGTQRRRKQPSKTCGVWGGGGGVASRVPIWQV